MTIIILLIIMMIIMILAVVIIIAIITIVTIVVVTIAVIKEAPLPGSLLKLRIGEAQKGIAFGYNEQGGPLV